MVASIKEMKWMILGGEGQLGQAMAAELARAGVEYISLTHKQLDITNEKDIRVWFSKEVPNVVLNAAAWTNVDSAEIHEEQAQSVNAVGPKLLATASAKIGAKYLQISTDYVFSGNAKAPWSENDVPSPFSAYGRTKTQGEKFVLETYPKGSFIVRTSWLYSPWGKNFVKTMLKIALEESRQVKVVYDQIGSPTSAVDLASQLFKMIQKGVSPGIYHGTNSGQASWYEFAQEIFTFTEQDLDRIVPISTSQLNRPAVRPAFSVLGCDHWLDEGMKPIQNWRFGLQDLLPTIIQAVKDEH